MNTTIALAATADDPNPNTPLQTSKGTLIDEFDSMSSWTSTGATLALDTANKTSGTASIKLTPSAAGGVFSLTNTMSTAQNLSALSNAELSLYTPNPDQIKQIDVRFYSDDTLTNYTETTIGDWEISSGWNIIRRVKSDFYSSANGVDLSKIKHVGVIVTPVAGQSPVINVDRMSFNVSGKPKIVFTFDDGWYDTYTKAYPIMKAKNFKATVYVNKGATEKATTDGAARDYEIMNEDELSKLYADGWDLANHTVGHHDDLANTAKYTDAQVKQEYLDNQNWLVSKGWKRGAYDVAYPSGSYSDRLVEILKGIGVKTARVTTAGIQPTPVNNIYKLKTVYVEENSDGTDRVPEVEEQIDKAIQTGSTIILMIHRVQDVVAKDTITTTNFSKVVDYVDQQVKNKKIEVATMSEWYNSYMGGQQPPTEPEQSTTVTSIQAVPDKSVAFGTTLDKVGLPTTVTLNLSNNTTKSANVTWDNGTPSYNPNTAGTYEFKGTLTLPNGVTNPNGLKASIKVTVNKEIPAVTVTSIQAVPDKTVAFGTTRDTVGLPSTVNVTLSNNSTVSANVTWDNGTPTYNSGKAGIYEFKGILGLSDGITNPNGLTASVKVTVKEDTSHLAAKGSLDAPGINVAISGSSNVSGWFLDGSGVAKIEVLIDGTNMGTAKYGSDRSDVQKAFPEYQNPKSGYQFTLDTTKLKNGEHTLVIRETSNNGKITELSQKVNVQNLTAKGYLDTPGNNAAISGSSNVSGWFLDGSGVAKIEVLIDGTNMGTAKYGSERSDVQKAFPEYKNASSGYQFTLDTTKISNGEHSLIIRETGNNGSTTELHQKVNVQNLLAKGYIDSPANNAAISGSTKVSGWFLDQNDVDKIEVLIDGTSVGTAQYGGARLDVQKAFPEYKNANSGYQFTLDTTKLTNGEHTLMVKETGKNGIATVLSQKVNVHNISVRGYIDAPANDSIISGDSNVSGWFLDKAGVDKIEVLVDGTSMGFANYGSERVDVQKAFPEFQNANSGYQFTLNTTKLTNGEHTLVIREIGKNGDKTELSQKVNVQNLPAKGYVDSLSSNSTISGSSKIQGWFLDGSGVAKIEVLIDGKSVGTAQYGGTRLDVQKAFPEYKNANSGYQYTLDTTKLTNGEHTITIRETGNNGTTTVLSQKVKVQN